MTTNFFSPGDGLMPMPSDNYHEALEEVIEFMDDSISQFYDDDHPSRSGYKQARHDVRDMQLTWSDRIDCECDTPTPEELRADGERWRCGMCEEVLLDEPGRDDDS